MFFEICRAVLKADAPVPQAIDSAALADNVKMVVLLLAHGAAVEIVPLYLDCGFMLE